MGGASRSAGTAFHLASNAFWSHPPFPRNIRRKASRNKPATTFLFIVFVRAKPPTAANLTAPDSAESRDFPIIAGLARQRSLPTKAEKPEPDINLIVSGYRARVIRNSPAKPQETSSVCSRSTSLGHLILNPSPEHVPGKGRPAVQSESLSREQSGTPEPNTTSGAPPPLEHTQGAGAQYASSAVTMLKTPSSDRRTKVQEPTPPPNHVQLLEDLVEQLPRGYSLYEQDSDTRKSRLPLSKPQLKPEYGSEHKCW